MKHLDILGKQATWAQNSDFVLDEPRPNSDLHGAQHTEGYGMGLPACQEMFRSWEMPSNRQKHIRLSDINLQH